MCGSFAEVKERAAETGVDVYYFMPPGREDDARRSWGRTPEMIDFFSKRIGVPYPHRRYSQIAVSDFIFGGMENTTATTLTDLALLDARAALDHDVEGLVAHELAHQWWGDLLTCREWPEAWLNEGFATYFEYVWREHAHGRDEADAELRVDADNYLGEAADRYQRPVVCRQYQEPIELFDSHLYEKGGRVLHMLRHQLGEEPFWLALRTYAEKHARQVGRDPRPAPGHRGGDRAQHGRLLRPVDRQRRPSGAGRFLAVGRRSGHRDGCASNRSRRAIRSFSFDVDAGPGGGGVGAGADAGGARARPHLRDPAARCARRR